jgi:hypothetical protein
MTNKYPLIYFIIAVGGNLKKPSVQRMEITKEEIDEYIDGGNETEDDAINYFIDEELAAWNQQWSPSIALTEDEFKDLAKDISKIPFTP